MQDCVVSETRNVEQIQKHAQEMNRETASDIQEISRIVTDAVDKLANEATKMLEFVNGDVIRDYDSFAKIASQYEQDAKAIQEILNGFSNVLSYIS